MKVQVVSNELDKHGATQMHIIDKELVRSLL